MKSALLFRMGGLGDLLVALPSIYLVRKTLSPCAITIVCRREYGELLREASVVDSILSESDPMIAPFFASAPLPAELSHWLESFSFVFGWWQKKSPLFLEKIQKEKRKLRVLSVEWNPSSNSPLSFYFYKKTNDFLISEGRPLFSYRECSLLPISPEQKKEGLAFLGSEKAAQSKRIAVVHPGSGSEEKCWPLENFLEIVRRLSSLGYRGAVVTGFAEERLEKKLYSSSLPSGWVWIHNPPLLQLAGLLSSASFYLGNDSGITHLAAACGIKGMALFRSRFVKHWKPYGRVSVLSAGDLSETTSKAVWEEIRKTTLQAE
ncbi:MAG: glycosyltransferase family 9 protein [Candidatus Aminicenantales bacterium]